MDTDPLSMSHSRTKTFAKLKEKILLKRPVLSDILHRHGSMTVFDFCRSYEHIRADDDHSRDHEFIGTLHTLVSGRLGQAVADDVAHQLQHDYQVSTADHHGPIVHPFFVNSNLIYSIPFFSNPAVHRKNLIVLSFASVSLNNSSEPRGILFHCPRTNGELRLHRLSFFPDKMKMATVLSAPAYSQESTQRMRSVLKEKMRDDQVHRGRFQVVDRLFDNIFEKEEILHAPRYIDQVTTMNRLLWREFFHDSQGFVPGLVTIDIESLVAQLLIAHHIHRADSAVYQILFNPEWSDRAATLFDGILGAFSASEGRGSFFFWAHDAKGHRVPLYRSGNRLTNSSGTMTFALDPDHIADALRSNQIFPGMLLAFILVSFIYKVKCLGGFNQVTYLTQMKAAWGELLRSFGRAEEARRVAFVQTDALSDGLTLAYLRSGTTLEQATGIDLILSPLENLPNRLVEFSKTVSLNDVIAPTLPEMYRVIYSGQDREEDVLALTSEEILEITGLGTKLTPMAEVEKRAPSLRSPVVPSQLSDYLPAGTHYYYNFPAGEESQFYNIAPVQDDEIAAARPLTCAGEGVQVITFSNCINPVVLDVLRNDLGMPIVADNQIKSLPSTITAHIEGAARNQLIKKAFQQLWEARSIVMTQPYLDEDIRDRFQISPEVSVYLNNKLSMSGYVPLEYLPETIASFSTGARFLEYGGALPLPCVVKVVSSCAGDGVAVCRTREDIASAKKQFSLVRMPIIVEQYIDSAVNISVNFGVPADPTARIQVIGYNEQRVGAKGDFLGGVVRANQSLMSFGAISSVLKERILPAVRAMGWYGIGGMDVLVDRNRNFKFIDPNFRMTATFPYISLMNRGWINHSVISFKGTVQGSIEDFRNAIVPVATQGDSRQRMVITSLVHQKNTALFHAGLLFDREDAIPETAQELIARGVCSTALNQLAKRVS